MGFHVPSDDRATEASGRPGVASGVGTLVYLSIGPILWAFHLLIVYGAQPLVCRGDAAKSPMLVLVVTLAFLAASVAAMLLPGPTARLLRATVDSRSLGRFHRRVMRWLVFFSAIGIAWAGAAAIAIPACEQLR